VEPQPEKQQGTPAHPSEVRMSGLFRKEFGFPQGGVNLDPWLLMKAFQSLARLAVFVHAIDAARGAARVSIVRKNTSEGP
jgi:hypothetical protein